MKAEINEPISRYSDYIEMLEKERPDLVAIATESGKHAQIAFNCMEHGAKYKKYAIDDEETTKWNSEI